MNENLLNLPEKYDPVSLEKRWRDEWEKAKIYSWDSSGKRSETYIVDTPPPTVSGSLHLGHIFSYTQTDLIVRFQRMKGKNIFYPMGWDDNGLPTERRVQNVFNVRCDLSVPYDPQYKSKRGDESKHAESISRSNFIELCSQLTKEDEEVFKSLFQRLGLSVDWDLEYATIDDHCRKISQLSFLDLVKKGEAYSVVAPSLWDVTFKTAGAQAEVEDRDHSGFFYDIKFAVEDGGEFIISTTRPELLPACIAIVAHPSDERYKKLFGKFAITPLFYSKVPILPAEHVELDKGTGIMMICTFGDTTDADWWKQSTLPLKQVIGPDGKLLKVSLGVSPFDSLNVEIAQKNYNQIAGLSAKEGAKKIHELLAEESSSWNKKGPALVGTPKAVTRQVKFYEKGDRPLEVLSSRQWFVKIVQHKEELLKQGEKIEWRPLHMKARYLDWVKNLNQDWCISRQRYFGVPFPVWYAVKSNGETDYDRPILASANRLPIDPILDTPEGYKESQRNQPNGFVAEKDVMDTWATSSLTPQISSFWEKDKQRHEKLFPADLRPQSHEIIRTWAFYTIVKAYHHERKIPWNIIAISGWILDPDRKKMSKSKGNVVTPEKYLDDYGGDSVRYWASRARLGVDTAFDENLFKIGRKVCNKIFNASKFVLSQVHSYLTNGNANNELLVNSHVITSAIDKAWMNRLKDLISKADAAFANTDYALALQLTEENFWYFCDHYVEFIKTRSYDSQNKKGQESAVHTLEWSLQTFLKLFAPFFPYLTEEVWSWRYSRIVSSSIHKSSWPESKEMDQISKEYSEIYLELAEEALSKIRAFKTKNQKKLKWPVDKLEILVDEKNLRIMQEIASDLVLAGNVKSENVTIKGGVLPADEKLVQMDIELALQELSGE